MTLNATQFEARLKDLVTRLHAEFGDPKDDLANCDTVEEILLGIFGRDTSEARAREALARLRTDMVDYNEMRVAAPVDVIDLLGTNFPAVREKAMAMVRVLSAIYNQLETLDMSELEDQAQTRSAEVALGTARYGALCPRPGDAAVFRCACGPGQYGYPGEPSGGRPVRTVRHSRRGPGSPGTPRSCRRFPAGLLVAAPLGGKTPRGGAEGLRSQKEDDQAYDAQNCACGQTQGQDQGEDQDRSNEQGQERKEVVVVDICVIEISSKSAVLGGGVGGRDLPTLKFGIPKGSLQESTFDLFRRAGFDIGLSSSRSYHPSIDDPELSCVMFRAQEMSRYVEQGIVDVGLTGYDWIQENQSDVVDICELVYSKATARPSRWVLAVPKDSKVQKPEDLNGGHVATELVGVTRRFFESHNVDVHVEFSWGATEVKAKFLDGIVDITETGSSLAANNLRIVADIMVTAPRLIANKQAWADPWKKAKAESIAMLLHSAIDGRNKVGMKMNVARKDLDAVVKVLPAEKSPTVSALADNDYVAVEVIMEERAARGIIPCLCRAGASGIFTYPLNTVIP